MIWRTTVTLPATIFIRDAIIYSLSSRSLLQRNRYFNAENALPAFRSTKRCRQNALFIYDGDDYAHGRPRGIEASVKLTEGGPHVALRRRSVIPLQRSTRRRFYSNVNISQCLFGDQSISAQRRNALRSDDGIEIIENADSPFVV